MVSISKGNLKMGSIMSVSLPRTTCRPDAPCRKDCYCSKGNFLFKNVTKAYESNLNILQANPEQYKNDILKQLPLIGMFRWHVCGDIPDIEYLNMMCQVARQAKKVSFLCFTKQYQIVNNYLCTNKIPSNLKIVFSGWIGLEMDNPNNLPTAWMYDKNNVDTRIPVSAKLCGGNCAECGVCWFLRKKQSVYFNKH